MTRRIHSLAKSNEMGFTIIETMIAIAISGLLILFVTVAVLNIGHLFEKGTAGASIQDNTRAVIDQVSDDLELSPGPVTSGSGTLPINVTINGTTVPVPVISYCVGDSVRYTATIGYEIGTGTEPNQASDTTIPYIPHILWRDNDSALPNTSGSNDDYALNQTNPGCKAINLDNTTSLAADDPSGSEQGGADSRLLTFVITGSGPYNVAVGEAYGPISLLTNTTPAAITSATSANPTLCKDQDGQQYCSADSLTTNITPRVSGN
jgi:type II secretory pathway pseudopilin PulG